MQSNTYQSAALRQTPRFLFRGFADRSADGAMPSKNLDTAVESAASARLQQKKPHIKSLADYNNPFKLSVHLKDRLFTDTRKTIFHSWSFSLLEAMRYATEDSSTEGQCVYVVDREKIDPGVEMIIVPCCNRILPLEESGEVKARDFSSYTHEYVAHVRIQGSGLLLYRLFNLTLQGKSGHDAASPATKVDYGIEARQLRERYRSQDTPIVTQFSQASDRTVDQELGDAYIGNEAVAKAPTDAALGQELIYFMRWGKNAIEARPPWEKGPVTKQEVAFVGKIATSMIQQVSHHPELFPFLVTHLLACRKVLGGGWVVVGNAFSVAGQENMLLKAFSTRTM